VDPRKNRDSRKKTHNKRRRYYHLPWGQAAEVAMSCKEDIDFVVFATLSPDYYFPGPGVLVT
jgi:hypothetical protein